MRWIVLACCGVLALVGCGPSSGPGSISTSDPSVARPAATKTLRIGTRKEPLTGIALFAGGGVGGIEPAILYHAGLTIYDDRGDLHPHVAQRVPSVADGDWRIADDGRMEVTWRLKPDVRWHDGTALSADDFVFGTQILRDEEIPVPRPRWLRLVDQVTAPDRNTLLVTWRQPYILANASGPIDIAAVPRHILGELYAAGDKNAFVNSTYWTQSFVGLGPYKLGEWVLGSRQEATAFDGYFLGRPRIDRIEWRFFNDINVMVANLLAGELDMVTVGSLRGEDLLTVKRAWEPSGGGTTIINPLGIRLMYYQYRNPALPWAGDVRVRRAMVHSLDRQTLVETLQYGLTTPADILAPPDDPIYKLVEERGLARYPYDLARADQLLNEAGWAKGQDGVYQRGGQQFTAEIRTVVVSPDNDREMLAISDQWKTAGFVSPIFRIPNEASPADKDEGRAKTEGVFVLPLENSPESLGDYHSSQIATEATRWRGNNRGGFSNPTYDRIYDEYISTLDVPKRNGLLADIQKLTADEVVYIPLAYDFGPFTSAVRKGVRGPGPLKPIQQANTWNVQTWEID